MLDKITLMALGIRPDTDPNNPETWSDELKLNHKRVLDSLGPDSSKVQVRPQGDVVGESASFVPASLGAQMYGEDPELGVLNAESISQGAASIGESAVDVDTSDLQDLDTAPKGVNKTEWSKLSPNVKEAVQEYIKAHREYVSKYSRNGKLPSEDFLAKDYRKADNTDASAEWNDLGGLIESLGEELGTVPFLNGVRTTSPERQVDHKSASSYELGEHASAVGAALAFKLLGQAYPVGFGKQFDRPEDFRAPLRQATKKELEDLSKNTRFDPSDWQDEDEPQSSSSSKNSYSDDEDEYSDEDNDYSYDDDEDYSDDEDVQEEETGPSEGFDGSSIGGLQPHTQALYALTDELNTHNARSSGYAAVKAAMTRVQAGPMQDTDEGERARIHQLLEEEKSNHKKNSIMHGALNKVQTKLNFGGSATPTVEEQNQVQTESGSNVSAQMTEAGVAPGQTPQRLVTTTDQNGHPNIMYTAPNGATSEQRAVYGPNKEHVGHVTIWKSSEGHIKGIMGPYDFDPDIDRSPTEAMQGMAALQSDNLDKNIAKNPSLYDGLMDRDTVTALAEPSNESLYNRLVKPEFDENDGEEEKFEEPEEQKPTTTTSQPVIEDAPISKGVMPDGSAPTWKDVHVAMTNGTRRTSTPGAKRYIKKVAPDLGGHVLDISDTFYAIQNHPGFTDEARKSSIDEIKSNVQPIYDWLKGKAESTPDEVATDLPRSLRQDKLISDYRSIMESKNNKPSESTGLTKQAQDVYDQSVTFANQAKEEGKLGPADVVYRNKPRGSVDSRGRSYNTSRSDMTSEQYEAWAAQKKAEGWTDWKAEKPLSSEDLAAQKKSKKSAGGSVRIPKAGSGWSSTLPKEQRFDSDLRPTNVDKEHWTALKAYHPEAAAFVAMYAHKWHNLVDSGTIAPEGNKISTGEPARYTVDQLKQDKEAILSKFDPRTAGIVHNSANNDKLYKLAPLLSSTKGYGLVDTDHDAGERINHILRAYPMPE